MKKELDNSLKPCAKMRLDSILSVLPIVEVKSSGTHVEIGGNMFDVVASIDVSGKPMKLFAEVVKRAEPRFARMAALELKSRIQSVKNGYGILVAPYISPTAVEICRESGVGCMDLSGNAFLSFGSVFIERSGRANAYLEARPLRSLFSPKTSRVLMAFFLNPSKRWQVGELSRAAGVSLGLASKAKQALLAQEWVEEDGRRLILRKPFELLKEWSRSYSFKKNRILSFYSGLSETALETAVKTECGKRACRYGLALFTGAARVAPYVAFPKFFAYIDGDIAEVAEALELKKVESGANVTLLEPYDDGVFLGLRQIGGASVVSDIQLYLDLMSYGTRGEDAAQAVFEQRIQPLW